MKLLLRLPAAVAIVTRDGGNGYQYTHGCRYTQKMMEEDDNGGEGSWHSSHFSSQRFLGLMRPARRRKSKDLVNDPFLPSYMI